MKVTKKSRKLRCRSLLICGAILAATFGSPLSAAPGEWTPVGIAGGSVVAVAVAPSATATLCAVSLSSGPFRSADSGASWTGQRQAFFAASSNLFNAEAAAFHSTNPNIIFYGGSFGLFRSTDGGAGWSALNDVLMDDGGGLVRVVDVAVDPVTPANVYVAGSFDGLFKSVDGGAAWSSLNSVLLDDGGGTVSAEALLIDPATPTHVYVAGGSDGLFETTDGGATWDSLNDVLMDDGNGVVDAGRLALDPSAAGTLYVAGRDGLFKSADGGATWSSLNAAMVIASGGLQVVTAMAVGLDGALLVALDEGTGTRAFLRSADRGVTWAALSGAITTVAVAGLTASPATASNFWAATSGGVFASTDGGTTWAESNDGLEAVLLDRVLPRPASAGRGIAGVTLYGRSPAAGLFKSTDGGATWAAKNSGLVDRATQALAMSPSAPDTLYVTNSLHISKSTDGGESWTANVADMTPFIGLLGPAVFALAVHPTDPDTVLAGNFGNPSFGMFGDMSGLFRSTDGGATWSRIYVPDSSLETFQPVGLAFDPANPERILAGNLITEPGFVIGGLVLLSTDAGTTWNPVLDGLGFPRPSFTPGAAWVTSSNSFGLAGGVRKSTDGGMTWNVMNNGLDDPPRVFGRGVAFDPAAPGRLYITPGGSAYISTDGATSWRQIEDFGLEEDKSIRDLAPLPGVTPATLAGAYNGGVYSYTSSEIFADGFESGDTSVWSASAP